MRIAIKVKQICSRLLNLWLIDTPLDATDNRGTAWLNI
jgi:hypothetical protein